MDSSHDLDEAKFEFQIGNYEYYRGDLPEYTTMAVSGIHRAVIEGDIDKAKRCIARGESVNKKESQYGYSPLHLAVMGMTEGFRDENSSFIVSDDPCYNDKMLEFLLAEEGVDLDSTCSQGWTPLYLAISFEEIYVVLRLIEAGADVNASDDENDRPLHLSVQYTSQMCEWLLEHGAVIHTDDKWKRTADMASFYGRHKVIEMLRQYNANL